MNSNFSIFAKHNKTHCIYDLSYKTTLNELKYKISDKIGLPVSTFYIVCCCKVLDTLDNISTNPTIEEYNENKNYKIEKDRTINVMVHPYNNIHKKLAYFFYENNCKLINIENEPNNSILKITAKIYPN